MECFAGSGVNLGVPADSVFYLAEIADEPESMANRRWSIGSDGAVLFGENAEPFDFTSLPGTPFNRPFHAKPIATIPPGEMDAFLGWLDSQGFFELPADSFPPPDVTVHGGVVQWVAVHRNGRTACLRLHPGAPMADVLGRQFDRLVDAHLPPAQ